MRQKAGSSFGSWTVIVKDVLFTKEFDLGDVINERLHVFEVELLGDQMSVINVPGRLTLIQTRRA